MSERNPGEQPKLVQIEWVDAIQPSSSWRYLNDAPELAVVRCVSVGWLVAENEHAKMLAPNIGGAGQDDPQGSGFIRIPVSAITRLVGLTEQQGEVVA